MSRATRFKIYRVLVIASIILIIPLLFIVGVTLPYLFNTIKVSVPEIAIGKDVERYITEKELNFKNTNAKARKKIIWNDDTKIKTEYSIVYLHGSFATGYQQEDVLVKVAEKLMEICRSGLFDTKTILSSNKMQSFKKSSTLVRKNMILSSKGEPISCCR